MLNAVDVFLVGGQSNAQGSGDPTEAPEVPEGIAYEFEPELDDLIPMAEPVGPGPRASAWSAFARSYVEQTDMPVVIVSRPAGGAAQHPAADLGGGHWEANDDHSVVALEALRKCLDHLDSRGITWTLQGILWHQGERDAISIEEGTIDQQDYFTAVQEMLAWFRESLEEPMLDLFVFKLGRRRSGDTNGFRAIRAAQDDLAEQDDYVHIVYEGAPAFAEDGRMHDDLHYTQAGYNEMGEQGARSVASIVME